MKLPVVEIGTSDFRTLAGVEDGLFIEPVYDRFKNLPDCRKENIAISDRETVVKVYYITDQDIKIFGLPKWVAGCSSIGKIHPTIKAKGWANLCHSHNVKVERIKTVLDRHGITGIGFLKIDTEGHDCIILNDFLNTCDFLPDRIQFEANELSDPVQVAELLVRLQDKGYSCRLEKTDMICVL